MLVKARQYYVHSTYPLLMLTLMLSPPLLLLLLLMTMIMMRSLGKEKEGRCTYPIWKSRCSEAHLIQLHFDQKRLGPSFIHPSSSDGYPSVIVLNCSYSSMILPGFNHEISWNPLLTAIRVAEHWETGPATMTTFSSQLQLQLQGDAIESFLALMMNLRGRAAHFASSRRSITSADQASNVSSALKVMPPPLDDHADAILGIDIDIGVRMLLVTLAVDESHSFPSTKCC